MDMLNQLTKFAECIVTHLKNISFDLVSDVVIPRNESGIDSKVLGTHAIVINPIATPIVKSINVEHGDLGHLKEQGQLMGSIIITFGDRWERSSYVRSKVREVLDSLFVNTWLRSEQFFDVDLDKLKFNDYYSGAEHLIETAQAKVTNKDLVMHLDVKSLSLKRVRALLSSITDTKITLREKNIPYLHISLKTMQCTVGTVTQFTGYEVLGEGILIHPAYRNKMTLKARKEELKQIGQEIIDEYKRHGQEHFEKISHKSPTVSDEKEKFEPQHGYVQMPGKDEYPQGVQLDLRNVYNTCTQLLISKSDNVLFTRYSDQCIFALKKMLKYKDIVKTVDSNKDLVVVFTNMDDLTKYQLKRNGKGKTTMITVAAINLTSRRFELFPYTTTPVVRGDEVVPEICMYVSNIIHTEGTRYIVVKENRGFLEGFLRSQDIEKFKCTDITTTINHDGRFETSPCSIDFLINVIQNIDS